MTIKLSSAGVRAVLKSAATTAAVHDLADSVAHHVEHTTRRGSVATADVRMVQTDRAHAIVALKHPASSAIEAKYGVLARAAAAAGVEVRGAE